MSLRERLRLGIRAPLARRIDAIPLRITLIALLLVLIVAPLAATGYATQVQLENFLGRQLDAQLAHGAEQAVTSTLFVAENPQARLPPSDFVVSYTRLAIGTGNLSTGQTPQPSDGLPRPELPAIDTNDFDRAGLRYLTVPSSTGSGHWRVLEGVFRDSRRGSDLIYAQIAVPMTQIEDAVARLRLLVFGIGLIATGLAALIGWAAIRRSLRPLQQIERTAAAIAGGDLSRRAPSRPASTEVGSLTASLNAMLTRIEQAFRAQEASEARTRRFAADASHELRTPLASIRGFAELYRQGAVPGDAVPRTMRRIEDEARRMGGLVEDLLLLARLDERRPGRWDPLDLLVLAGDAVHDARGLDPSRSVTLVGLDGPSPASAPAQGDEDRLRQVVANLIGNAVRHTPQGTPIEVAVGQRVVGEARLGVLEVRDHGPGLDPDQISRVFERFYRVDSSRWRGQGGGSGLGLSIVAAVVGAHGGTVAVQETDGGGATFTFTLPVGTPEDIVKGSGRDGADSLHGA